MPVSIDGRQLLKRTNGANELRDFRSAPMEPGSKGRIDDKKGAMAGCCEQEPPPPQVNSPMEFSVWTYSPPPSWWT